MKVRKLPVEVNAEYFDGSVDEARRLNLNVHIPITTGPDGEYEYKIKTLEGWMDVKPGSWIITGVHGERYACDGEIFEKTYEGVCPKCGRTFSFLRTTTKQRCRNLWCCSQDCLLKMLRLINRIEVENEDLGALASISDQHTSESLCRIGARITQAVSDYRAKVQESKRYKE